MRQSNSRRRLILSLCPIVLGTTFAAGCARGAKADSRPNILFVFTDDQSHRTVGCYEEAPRWVQTPHIDRLADEGVRFANAYAASWCLPSRAMVLTGLHQHAIRGVTIERNPNSRYDPRLCKFWPAELRKAGYMTAAIGKWHLSVDTGHGRDWDHSVIWNHSVPELAGDYFVDQKLNIDGGPYTPVGGYSTDNYTDYAVDFIRCDHDQPWFLWLCYDAVHHPFLPADRHRNRFQKDQDVAIPTDIYPPRPDKPRYARNYGLYRPNEVGIPMLDRSNPLVPLDLKRAPDALPEAVRQYNRGVLAIDEGVGRLLAALDQSDQLDRTVIVFTSDQGFAWGQHGFAWKIAPYDANMRVPFIVRMTGRVARGKVCRHPVAAIDLVTTFFALAEAKLPWKMHGHDLSPLLQNPSAGWPHPVLLEHFFTEFGSQTDRARGADDIVFGVPWWLFLRQGRYKYIRTLEEDEIEELYDLESDPQELVNLAIDAGHQQTLREYRQRLLAELRRTDAGLVNNLPQPRVVLSPRVP